MTNALLKTLIDVAELLRMQRLPFAVIGVIAVAVRGEPRLTADVDLVIAAELDQAQKLAGQLEGTPFRSLFADVSELIQSAFVFPVRHQQTTVRVDIAIGLSGFERHAIGRATAVEIEGHVFPVATAEDLILMKVLAARPRDLDDARRIAAKQRQSLDWDYLHAMANDLQNALELDLAGRIDELARG